MGIKDHCRVGPRRDGQVARRAARSHARLDDLRKDVVQDDKKVKSEGKRLVRGGDVCSRCSEDFAHGYGGKFGVQSDRKDKSAFGMEERMAA